MISRFRVQNYKALHDVVINLTPIHVLIGPNDSGKTSILEAIAALCRSVDRPLPNAFTGTWDGRELVWMGKRDLAIALEVEITDPDEPFTYGLSCSCLPRERAMRVETEYVDAPPEHHHTDLTHKGFNRSQVCRIATEGLAVAEELQNLAEMVSDTLQGVESFRWDGRFLALPVAPDSKRRFRLDSSGFGLALLLDDILGFDRNRFNRLEDRFRAIFPAVKSIKLIPERAFKSPVDDPEQIPKLQELDGKGLYFEFEGIAKPVSARQVSDGILLILAYLALLHLPQPPRVLLVEEPENGIHPKRLEDVLSILRELVSEQSHTQVVLTTHSPYVVDHFQPDEVTLCQKGKDGSVSVHRLSESKTVREQLDVFTLGEIWTAEGETGIVQSAAPAGEL